MTHQYKNMLNLQLEMDDLKKVYLIEMLKYKTVLEQSSSFVLPIISCNFIVAGGWLSNKYIYQHDVNFNEQKLTAESF